MFQHFKAVAEEHICMRRAHHAERADDQSALGRLTIRTPPRWHSGHHVITVAASSDSVTLLMLSLTVKQHMKVWLVHLGHRVVVANADSNREAISRRKHDSCCWNNHDADLRNPAKCLCIASDGTILLTTVP